MFVEYYNRNGSPVFACFLDASKAFDRVCHYKLFCKLISRNVHIDILRVLVCWYFNQRFSIKWGNCISFDFSVSNGVRQGGVLSPLLYNVYTDDLTVKLSKSKYGCEINNVKMNNLCYADDMILVAPSVIAL